MYALVVRADDARRTLRMRMAVCDALAGGLLKSVAVGSTVGGTDRGVGESESRLIAAASSSSGVCGGRWAVSILRAPSPKLVLIRITNLIHARLPKTQK